MRGLIILSNSPAANLAEAEITIPALLDRSFVEYAVEYVLDQGVYDIDFVFTPSFRSAKTLLGSGVRWGGHFVFHPAADELAVISTVRHLYERDHVPQSIDRSPLLKHDPILMAHADRLPDAPVREAMLSGQTTLFYSAEEKRLLWTGWAIVPCAALAAIPRGADEAELAAYLQNLDGGAQITMVGPPLTCRTHADILYSNKRGLARELRSVIPRGKEARPGIWLGRNVSIHRTASVIAPALLGDNSVLGAHVQVGPGAVVGTDCVIDQRTIITDSVVCKGSYVGAGLDLESVLVDRTTVVNIRLNAVIEGMDEFLLGRVESLSVWSHLRSASGRLLAILIVLLSSPLLASIYLLSKLGMLPTLVSKPVVRAPTVCDPARWSTFDLFHFDVNNSAKCVQHWFYFILPALTQVVLGNLQLVGPEPLTPDELEQLPYAARVRHLRSKPGLLSDIAHLSYRSNVSHTGCF